MNQKMHTLDQFRITRASRSSQLPQLSVVHKVDIANASWGPEVGVVLQFIEGCMGYNPDIPEVIVPERALPSLGFTNSVLAQSSLACSMPWKFSGDSSQVLS